MKHIFPFTDIPKGEHIVLYGASERGYDFYRQLISTGFDDVVLWVDRQYEWYKYMGLPVEAPEKINDVKYDRIVITAEAESVYRSMLHDLDSMEVDLSKTFWKKDCLISEIVPMGYDVERIRKEAEKAEKESTKSLLRRERLDIIVRVLYAKDIVLDREFTCNQKLYKKLMMVQNNGAEPTENLFSAFFTEYTIKKGWKAFDYSFRELIRSMRDEGFKKEYFIPLSKNNYMINGAHRLASAIALSKDVWVYKYPVEIKPLVFDEKWFDEKGFSTCEIEYLVKKYDEIAAELLSL